MRQNLILLIEKFHSLSPVKKLLLVLGLISICFILIFIAIAISSTSTSTTPSTPKIPPQTPPKQTILPAPKVAFASYTNTALLPTVPEKVNVYTLKTSFLLEEIGDLGSQLGLSNQKRIGEQVILSNTDEQAKEGSMGILVFNTRTGEFSYQSFSSNPSIPATPTSASESALSFLITHHLADRYVTCPITYQRNDIPDATVVECHRDWGKIGLPIPNTLGTINVPETIPLSRLTLGKIDTSIPDATIINTSTGEDGLARPNDFNTINVMVGKDGSILSVHSNMRTIAKTEEVAGTTLLSPEQALEAFQQNKSQLSLTLQAGSGAVDYQRVYPNNLAQAKTATITDYVLVYLELPPDVSQTNLVPMYLIRGTTQLDSGYRVKFTQILPAVKGTVAGETTSLAQTDSSLKLGTFQPSINPSVPLPTPTTTSTQITSIPTGTTITIPPSDSKCTPPISYLNPIYTVNGLTYGYFTYLYYIPTWSLSFDPKTSAHTPQEAQTRLEEMQKLFDIITQIEAHYSQVLETDPASKASKQMVTLRKRSFGGVLSEFSTIQSGCALRVTGGSPTLFIYGNPGTKLSLSVNHPLTYADPPLTQSLWDTTMGKDVLTVNGLLRQFIYYEYQPVQFTKPDTGWVIKKSEIEDFAKNTLAPELQLTATETDRLIFELSHAAFSINSEYIFIGPIDQKEIDVKLPLSISPKPELVTRLHFYVHGQDTFMNIKPPTLSPIERKTFMILELGAFKG